MAQRNRIIYSRSSSQKCTFWSQDIFSLQIPLAHYVSIFQLPRFPFHAPFLPFHFRVHHSGPLTAFPTFLPCFHFHSPFLVDTFPITHIQSAFDNLMCSTDSAAPSAWIPRAAPLPTAHSFSLHQSGHPMLPQSCPSHEVSDWACKPLLRLLHFASLVADLQLPWCFRQVSRSAFIVAVLHAEDVQPGCYLNQLSVSKITFSVKAVGLALCTTASNALLLFPEQLPFPLEYWQAAFLRQNIKSPAALSKCLSSSGTGSRT